MMHELRGERWYTKQVAWIRLTVIRNAKEVEETECRDTYSQEDLNSMFLLH